MKTSTIVLSVIIAILLIMVVILCIQPKSFGTEVHNSLNSFIYGLQVGTVDQPGCIKVRDYNNGGWTYVYTISGTVSSSTSAPFSGACQ